MTTEQFLKNIEDTFAKCLATAKAKNNDYAGSRDPFANFRLCEKTAGVESKRGILVRLSDKISRLNTLLDVKEGKVTNEKLQDTIEDAINYLAILKAKLDEEESNKKVSSLSGLTLETASGGADTTDTTDYHNFIWEGKKIRFY